jgi:hypothetical protein
VARIWAGIAIAAGAIGIAFAGCDGEDDSTPVAPTNLGDVRENLESANADPPYVLNDLSPDSTEGTGQRLGNDPDVEVVGGLYVDDDDEEFEFGGFDTTAAYVYEYSSPEDAEVVADKAASSGWPRWQAGPLLFFARRSVDRSWYLQMLQHAGVEDFSQEQDE